MNKNEKPSFLKGRGAAVGIVLCFVAVIVMVGTFTFNSSQKQLNDQLAQAERELAELTEDKEAAANDISAEKTGQPDGEDGDEMAAPTENTQENGQNGTSEKELEPREEETSAASEKLWFSEESVLDWPASGALLMGYSMDETVYFSTLDQYKYNPALIISGEVGETICAAAPGVVSSIVEDPQTGTTITLDLGNGYSAVYGQLTELSVSDGQYLEKGEALGELAQPTKYYSAEGPNLYFGLLKDGEPTDPMNFME